MPSELYDSYVYRSGQALTFRRHAARVARLLLALAPGHRVLDVGANDGTLLEAFMLEGCHPDELQGVDVFPVPPDSSPVRDRILAGEFPDVTPSGPFDIITGLNVLNATRSPGHHLARIQQLLSPMGLAYVEMPYLVDIVRGGSIELLYHEHRHHWLVAPLTGLAESLGLEVCDVEHLPMQGGSIGVTLAHLGAYPHAHGADPWPWFEKRTGFHDAEGYGMFMYQAHRRTFALQDGLREKPWWAGYGAAAKTQVLGHVAGLTPQLVRYVVDDCEAKQGRWLSWGAEVVSIQRLRDDPPPGIVCFPGNISEDLLAKLAQADWHGPVLIVGERMRFVTV